MIRHRSVSDRSARIGFLRTGLSALAVASFLVASPAFADSATGDMPSPRVAVTVGGVSVVVIAANNQLYAFLDRTADNAPVPGGTLRVTAAKNDMALKEVSPGVYVSGRYVPPSGRTPLSIMVESAQGSGRATADLVIEQARASQPAAGRLRTLWFVLGISALTALGWVAWRDRRRLRLPFAGTGTA